MNKVLYTRSKIASSSPNVLDKSDIFWINLEFFCEPTIVELYTFILEKYELTRFVENLNANHHKTGKMASSQTNVIEIVET
jgi:hypothetical protein